MSGYLSALPRSLGGLQRRSGPSAAEARAALQVLRELSAAANGGGGSEEKDNLEYLSVREDIVGTNTVRQGLRPNYVTTARADRLSEGVFLHATLLACCQTAVRSPVK